MTELVSESMNEQFGGLYMHNHNEKHLARMGVESGSPGFELRTSEFQATVSHCGRPGHMACHPINHNKAPYTLNELNVQVRFGSTETKNPSGLRHWSNLS